MVVETSALEGSLELALEELRRELNSPVSYDVSSQVMGGIRSLRRSYAVFNNLVGKLMSRYSKEGAPESKISKLKSQHYM